MCPDINSLPPSRPSSVSPLQPRNRPSSSNSPQRSLSNLHSTIANMNGSASGTSAAPSGHDQSFDLPRRSSRSSRSGMSGSERRRSANLNLSNPGNEAAPDADHRSSFSHHALRTSSPSSLGGSPVIATGDPHHQRAPSLGELHQELENEQEAQVNRLLQMIRSQQSQLQHLQHQQSHPAIDDSAPSERSSSIPPVPPLPAGISPLAGSGSRTSTQHPPTSTSRRLSRTSQTASPPTLRPLADFPHGSDTLDWVTGSGEIQPRRSSRDESAFYQAEAAMLGRENQMLRQRIRDLERQVNELSTSATARSDAPPAAHGTASADPQATAGVGSVGEPSDKT